MDKKNRYQGNSGRGNPANKQKTEGLSWGRQVVLQLLRESPDRVQKVFLGKNAGESFARQIKTLAADGGIAVQAVDPDVLSDMCGQANHQGVACRSGDVSIMDFEDLMKTLPAEGPLLLVVLDHIQDPHNLGAIVRSAEACGASGILFPRRRGALPGGTVVKVSVGAALRLPMAGVTNIVRTIEQLQEAGFWTLGLENKRGRSLWEGEMPERVALVVGAEGEGLSRLAAETCDDLVQIPITGKTGSLNASVACALGMFEWARKWGPGVNLKGK